MIVAAASALPSRRVLSVKRRKSPAASSSFAGFVLWLGVVLVQDYWINGY